MPVASTTAKKTTIPAGVKAPQDRQTAKEDVEPATSVYEWEGTEYTVDPELIDDLEFFEALENNQFATAVHMMLGTEQYAKFKGQVKKAEGRVSLGTTQSFLDGFMKAAKRPKS